MNPEFPQTPRDQIEAQITAMLLGELSEPDAAALRAQIAADPTLAALESRLAPTIALLKQAAADPEGEKLKTPEPVRMSEARRDTLLKYLKGETKPEPSSKIVRVHFDWKTWGSLAAMVAFLLTIVSSMFFPGYTRSRAMAQRTSRSPAPSFMGQDDADSISERPYNEPAKAQFKAHPGAELGRALSSSEQLDQKRTLAKPATPIPPPAKDSAAFGDQLGIAEPAVRIALPEAKVEAGQEAPARRPGIPTLGDQPIVGSGFGFGGAGYGGGFSANRGFAPKNDHIANLDAFTPAVTTPSQDLGFVESKKAGLVQLSEAPSGGRLRESTPTSDDAAKKVELPALRSQLQPRSETESLEEKEKAVDKLNGQANSATAADSLSTGLAAAPATPPVPAKSIERQLALSDRESQETVGKNITQQSTTPAGTNEQDLKAPEGMGMGGMMSMNYYKSNPELMKRYFPQMYQMMKQKAGEQVAEAKPNSTPAVQAQSERFGRSINGATVDFEPETVRSYESELVPASKAYEDLKALNTEIKGKDRRALREFPFRDETLREKVAEEKNVELQIENAKKRNANEQEIQQLTQTATTLNAQIDQRIDGLMTGLKALTEASKTVVDRLEKRGADREAQQKQMVAEIRAQNPVPQPEVQVAENAFSTFSLNVSDVSFKLAAASLEKGVMPDPATVRSEEFINAFDYHDPEPTTGAPVAFAWERARYPFAQDRDMLRFSVKTAAVGREAGKAMNIVLLLDSSGSMERADRVRIIQECLRVLASQLQPQDRISVVAFARRARLWVDGLEGSKANELPALVGTLTPEGGTNLEDAMDVAYQTALRHFIAGGVNRVVLLTDGAANLGDVDPASLKKKVEAQRKQGIALDCFGIGWDGLNDDLLEQLSRNGDGRYGFINTPEAAATDFAGQLAGALKVAASDVKVQVEFNPKRAIAYRQIGYAKHQLTKEQFRDNTVDAAELGAAEAGNALYTVQVNPDGEGPIATVRVRFKIPGTEDYREHEWAVPYEGASKPLEQSSAAMRLATVASAFSEWLVASPYAGEVTTDQLLNYLNNVPAAFGADPRPKTLETMIRQAKSLAGK